MNPPILPGATIGMVGGGQLGRMFALEARRMGYRLVVLDPGDATPAAQFCDEHIRAPFEDLDACLELARVSDVVTLEWENADVSTLRKMGEHVRIHPSPDVLEVAQHRVRELYDVLTKRDVEVKFADGSNRFFVDFQVLNHRYGVASVAFVTEGGQTPIPRESYNHFVFKTGSAPPVQLRITATTGQVLEHTFDHVDMISLHTYFTNPTDRIEDFFGVLREPRGRRFEVARCLVKLRRERKELQRA